MNPGLLKDRPAEGGRRRVRPRTRRQARDELWRRGIVARQPGKAHDAQKLIYAALQQHPEQRTVWLNCSRRFGKTTLMLFIAVEHCLTVKRGRVRYAAPQKADAEEIATDLMEEVLKGCPPALRPKYNRVRKEYFFPSTGATLRFGGVNGDRARYLRGRRATLILVDEAGEMDDLRYVIDSILRPQLLTTGGRMIIASTPARSPGHESTAMARDCQALGPGAYFTFTIHQNPLLSAEQIAEECKAQGGEESSSWKREYLCQFVIDAELAIVHEWEARAEKLVLEVEPARWRDCYVSIDLGGSRDLTVALGSWWDWKNRVLVFEWEWWSRNPTTDAIAGGIKAAIKEHWGDKRPLRIVSDIDNRFQVDLAKYGLNVENAEKDDADAALADFRTWVGVEKIRVHPRCRLLINTLHQGVWNKKKTDWARLPTIGHSDAIAAAIYGKRAVYQNRNPTPLHPDAHPETHWLSRAKERERTEEATRFIEQFTGGGG